MRTLLFALASLLVLTACGPKRPQLEPPGVRIVGLELSDIGQTAAQPFTMSLRVKNTADVVLPSPALELELRIDGSPAGIYSSLVALDIPPQASEVIQLDGQLNSRQVAKLLELMAGQRRQLPYSLDGQAQAAGRSLNVRYEGWLNATPGKPGSFR